MSSHVVTIHGGQVEVDQAGSGPPLLYLHGIWDAREEAFAGELAKSFTVVRPMLPGFGQSTGGEQLHDVHDAIYYLLDVLDELDLDGVPIVGHCLGGMFAAELAAVQPRRFRSLVLISAFGLWNPEHPTLDFFAASAPDVARAVYGPGGAPPELADLSIEEKTQRTIEQAKAREVAARFLWPLPNRGLRKRAHRITMPALIVWGSEDGITPPQYGLDFRQLIAGSELHVVQGAAHMPHLEQPQAVVALVDAFAKR